MTVRINKIIYLINFEKFDRLKKKKNGEKIGFKLDSDLLIYHKIQQKIKIYFILFFLLFFFFI